MVSKLLEWCGKLLGMEWQSVWNGVAKLVCVNGVAGIQGPVHSMTMLPQHLRENKSWKPTPGSKLQEVFGDAYELLKIASYLHNGQMCCCGNVFCPCMKVITCKCSLCEKSFASKRGLETHKGMMHQKVYGIICIGIFQLWWNIPPKTWSNWFADRCGTTAATDVCRGQKRIHEGVPQMPHRGAEEFQENSRQNLAQIGKELS